MPAGIVLFCFHNKASMTGMHLSAAPTDVRTIERGTYALDLSVNETSNGRYSVTSRLTRKLSLR